MSEAGRSRFAAVPDPPRPDVDREYDRFVDTGKHGIVRRFLATARHVWGLSVGGLDAWLRGLPERERRRPLRLVLRVVVWLAGLTVDRKLRREPFPVQFRKRLERLGPTYIKLGQILSIREDLLPRSITDELKNLLDHLPAVPYDQFLDLIQKELRVPVDAVFSHVSSTPLGSASIGQIHLATLHGGEQVVVKAVKPGIRETLRRDALLLKGLGGILQLIVPRFQPRRVIREFCDYTLREADLAREADNAETFASAFRDQPDVVFPRIHREHSTDRLLVMEFLDGIKPTDPRAQMLSQADRERLIGLGAEAILSMLYRDGFFHADLHPANLLILPGPKCGFIDLGMVGRFGTDLKRALLYYYFCLILGDSENAAHYLALIAEAGPGADPVAFRRDVEDICRRWSHRARFGQFSLGKLVLESVSRGAAHGMYFPVEMVLMVKAIVTYEGVGQILMPGFDVAALSKRHVQRILLQRFGPLRIAEESLTALPEIVDALAKAPRLITEGLRMLEETTKRPASNPFAGMRATLFGGFCLVSGAILAAFDGPWFLTAALLAVGILLPLRRGS